MTRTSLLETLGADYVRTARAKGASDWRVTIRHALRNAMIPVVTLVGLQIGFLLGGSIVTETMFAWPGVGRMAVGAITSSDFPLAQGAILILAVGFMVINLAVDVLYAYLDPRISSDHEKIGMTDAALSLQSEADQRAIAAIRRKNAVWRRILRDPAAAAAAFFLFIIVMARDLRAADRAVRSLHQQHAPALLPAPGRALPGLPAGRRQPGPRHAEPHPVRPARHAGHGRDRRRRRRRAGRPDRSRAPPTSSASTRR